MCGNALAAMEDFDRARRDTRPDLLAQQLVRHRVVVLVDLDVIVEPDPAFLPLGEDIGLGRQRLEGRPFQILEQSATACTQMARHPGIDAPRVRRWPRSMRRVRRTAGCAAWR